MDISWAKRTFGNTVRKTKWNPEQFRSSRGSYVAHLKTLYIHTNLIILDWTRRKDEIQHHERIRWDSKRAYHKNRWLATILEIDRQSSCPFACWRVLVENSSSSRSKLGAPMEYQCPCINGGHQCGILWKMTERLLESSGGTHGALYLPTVV